jgi:hypothetical protein
MDSVVVEELWKITRKIRQCRWFVDWVSNSGHPQYQEYLQLHHKVQFEALVFIVHSNRYVLSTTKRNGCDVWIRFMKIRIGFTGGIMLVW